MVKYWAKTLKNHKIKKQYLFQSFKKADPDLFFEFVSNICEEMDIPTPVILNAHLKNFHKFNIVKFLPSDFVEYVDFDNLTIENISE